MPSYISETFTVASDTGFKDELIEAIRVRNIYVNLLGLQSIAEAKNFVLFMAVTGPGGGGEVVGAKAFQSSVKSEAETLAAAIKNGVTLTDEQLIAYLEKASAEMEALPAYTGPTFREQYYKSIAEDAADNIASTGVFKSSNAYFPTDIEKIFSRKKGRALTHKDISSAHLAYLVAKRNLLQAITADVGADYEVVKFIGETPYAARQADGNSLILGLVPPAYITDDATLVTDTTVTLHSTINPKHISSTAYFTLYQLNEDGSPNFATLQYVPNDTGDDIGNGVNQLDFSKAVTGLVPEKKYQYYINVDNKYLGTFLALDAKNFTTLEAVHPVLPITVYCTGGYTGGNTTLANGLVDPNGCTPVSRGTITTEADIGSSVDVNGAAVLAGTPYSSVEVQALDITGTLVYSAHTFHNSGPSPVSMTVTYSDCVAWIAAGSIFAGGGAWCNNKMGD